MVINDLLAYKFFFTAVIVVALSFVAEKISPRWAGILSGFPTGSAITLYFYGLENGLKFAGNSAIYNMVGLVAMQMFIFCYYLGGRVVKKHSLAMAICCGGMGYGVSAELLSKISVTPLIAVIMPLFSFVLFKRLLQGIGNSRVKNPIRTNGVVIATRAGIAALTIMLITEIAGIVGPEWAGLFSAFPTTLFPLLLIIHYTYGPEYAYAIIKHVPDGLGGLLVYSLSIYLLYPKVNLVAGIGLAFCSALFYLLLYQLVTNWLAGIKMGKKKNAEI